jgi:hypothetical protein
MQLLLLLLRLKCVKMWLLIPQAQQQKLFLKPAFQVLVLRIRDARLHRSGLFIDLRLRAHLWPLLLHPTTVT